MTNSVPTSRRPITTSAGLLLLCAGILGCRSSVTSSPEGTSTTFVEASGVRVYSPRAARAQKIVFDDNSQQLIHERDTPFRKFFDSRAADFASSDSLEEAKTTILGDIVNRLRNRSFVRGMLESVVERHIDHAIGPVTSMVRVWPVNTKTLDVIPAGSPTWVALSKAELSALRKRNARRLVDALEGELHEIGYPRLRDGLIDEHLNKFFEKKLSTIARLGTLTPVEAIPVIHQRNRAALEDDLRHTIVGRDYFRDVIEAAVLKRLHVFKRSGPNPVARMRGAIEALEKFVESLGAVENSLHSSTPTTYPLAYSVVAGRESLWESYWSSQLRESSYRFRVAEADSVPSASRLSAARADSLGLALRADLVKRVGSGQDLEAAMRAALSELAKAQVAPDVILDDFRSPADKAGKLTTGRATYAKTMTELAKSRAEVRASIAEVDSWGRALKAAKAEPVPAGADAAATKARQDKIAKLTEELRQKVLGSGEDGSSGESLLQVLGSFLESQNQALAAGDRQDLKRLREELRREVSALAAVKTLLEDGGELEGTFLDTALALDYRLSAAKTREAIARDFARVFSHFPDALASDKPILEAVFASTKLAFGRNASRSAVARKVQAALSEKKALTESGTTPTLLSDALEEALVVPETTFLFGGAPEDAGRVTAFQEEFFQAFRHRLSEALAAERDVDYDYWWLTFYPKAIPLGESRFEGESIVEVNFPQRIASEDQYQRWLQDHRPGWGVATIRSQIKSRVAGEVTRDFLGVLGRELPDPPESQRSTRRSETLRIAADALEVLSGFRVRGGDGSGYDSIRRFLWSEVERVSPVTRELRKPDSEREDKSSKRDQAEFEDLKDVLCEASGPLTPGCGIKAMSLVEDLSPEQSRAFYSNPRLLESLDEALQQGRTPKSRAAAPDLVPSIEVSQRRLKDQRDFANNVLVLLDAVQKPTLGDLRHNRRRAAEVLAARPFGPEHILWAVVIAGELRSSLPAKVELFLNAYFDGAEARHPRRYQPHDYLVPFPGWQERWELLTWLGARGVQPDSIRQLDRSLWWLQVQQQLLLEKREANTRAASEKEIRSWANHEKLRTTLRARLGITASQRIRFDRELHLSLSPYPSSEEVALAVGHAYAEATGQSSQDGAPAIRRVYERLLEDKGQPIPPEVTEFLKANTALGVAKAAATGAKDELARAMRRFTAAKDRLERASARRPTRKAQLAKARKEKRNAESKLSDSRSTAAKADTALAKAKEAYGDKKTAALRALATRIGVLAKDSLATADWREDIAKARRGRLRRISLHDMLCDLSPLNPSSIRLLFRDVTYAKRITPSRYLEHVELWKHEMLLDRAEAELRQIVVDSFFAAYPDVPSKLATQDRYLREEWRLKALIYQWLRPLWREAKEDGILLPKEKSEAEKKKQEKETKAEKEKREEEEAQQEKRRKQLMEGKCRRYFDSQPFLSAEVRRDLVNAFHKKGKIDDWLAAVHANAAAMDQLREHLLGYVHKSLWEACDRLASSHRHEVQSLNARPEDYERFREWVKPRLQRGIQIMEVLPASRDDLVALSIRDGGVVARAAAMADGAAAYDLNELQTARRTLTLLDRKTRGEEATRNVVEDGTAAVSSSSVDYLKQLQGLRQSAAAGAGSLGATGEGSVFGRARGLLAYSRRREYLDAVITAAGRGDNFAKWVIRPGDLRSGLVGESPTDLVAGKHTGHPNGDQPFHLMVKIPREAVQTDWNGRRYVLFNSAYTATWRRPLEAEGGWLGWLAKILSWLIHPPLVDLEETGVVGTVFPFRFDAKDEDQQRLLLSKPSLLGGRVYLDDTDKVKYSEVRRLVDAEAGFVRATRALQSSDLDQVMKEIQAEEAELRGRVRETLERRRQAAFAEESR